MTRPDWELIKATNEGAGGIWDSARQVFEFPGGAYGNGVHLPASYGSPHSPEDLAAAWREYRGIMDADGPIPTPEAILAARGKCERITGKPFAHAAAIPVGLLPSR